MRRRAQAVRSKERGFSILELIVALLISVELLIAMAIAFDVHNKVARVQLQITDLQQSQRIAQYSIARMLRMAGRGGLKLDFDPDAVWVPPALVPSPLKGMAIEVRNNVSGADTFIARGDATSPVALAGTDILTVRGCYATPLYQINRGVFDSDPDTPGILDTGTIVVPSVSEVGISQPLQPFLDEIAASGGGTLILQGAVNKEVWGIAAITAVDNALLPASVALTLNLDTDSPLNAIDPDSGLREFPPLSSTIDPFMVCLLEEYRFYIHDVQEAADPATPLRPRLTRARFEPGTETPYLGLPSNFELDIADQIFDLQIALGLDTTYTGVAGVSGSFDTDLDNLGNDDKIYEAAAETPPDDRTIDDWLYNDVGDDPTDVEWGDPLTGREKLYFVRVSTAARTNRPDPSYQAPNLDFRLDGDWIEDHDYDTGTGATYNSTDNRKHRRRVLTTIVEMRNIE